PADSHSAPEPHGDDAAANASAEESPPMTTRRFEFSEGTSNKFWTITLQGASHTVNYGRIGSAGQTSTAQFGSEAEARKSCDKLVAEKLKKGYVEKAAGGGATNGAPTPAPVRKATSPPAAPTPAANSAAGTTAASPAKASATKHDLHRPIDLELTAYSYVPGRRSANAPFPPAEPFDLEDCLKRFREKVRVKTYGWMWDFSHAIPHRTLAPEEAEFWLTAMTRERNPKASLDHVAAELQRSTFTGKTPADANLVIRYLSPQVVQCLAALLSADELRDLLLDPKGPRNTHAVSESDRSIRIGFRAFVLPYLDEAAIAQWAAAARHLWPRATWPSDYYSAPPSVYYYGAMLGLQDEVRALAAQLPDDLYADTSWDHTHYHRPQEILYGAGSAEKVAHHFRRLRLPTNAYMDIQTFVAVTGVSALDVVVRTIANTGKKEDAEELFEAFER